MLQLNRIDVKPETCDERTLVVWPIQKRPFRDSARGYEMRSWEMRTGISFTVSTSERTQLEAIAS
ncbi:MAG: hypothetical protein AAF668_16185, partial [Pseudomonadota bacterium]